MSRPSFYQNISRVVKKNSLRRYYTPLWRSRRPSVVKMWSIMKCRTWSASLGVHAHHTTSAQGFWQSLKIFIDLTKVAKTNKFSSEYSTHFEPSSHQCLIPFFWFTHLIQVDHFLDVLSDLHLWACLSWNPVGIISEGSLCESEIPTVSYSTIYQYWGWWVLDVESKVNEQWMPAHLTLVIQVVVLWLLFLEYPLDRINPHRNS